MKKIVGIVLSLGLLAISAATCADTEEPAETEQSVEITEETTSEETETSETTQAVIDVTVTVTGNSAEYIYDGLEHSVKGYEISCNDETFDVSSVVFSGTDEIIATEVGEYPMGLSADMFTCSDEAFNATFEVTDGVLKINTASVEIPESKTFVFDGTEKSCVPESEAYSIDGTNTAVDAGQYEITLSINASGGYLWSDGTNEDKTLSWAIEQADASEASVAVNDINIEYTGEEITPNVLVGMGGITLERDKDYTIQYSDNVNVGTALVTVSFTGNYKGEASATFEIAPVSYSVPKSHSYVYSGEEKSLDTEEYYTYSGDYSGTNAGEYIATAVLVDKTTTCWNDGSTDDKQVTLTIEPYVVTNAQITTDGESTQIVIDNGTDLVEGQDFTAEYDIDTDLEIATVKITYIGNYTGADEVTGDVEIVNENEHTFILNTRTGKYHYNYNCNGLNKSNPKNLSEVTATIEEMHENGYSPCKLCNPDDQYE